MSKTTIPAIFYIYATWDAEDVASAHMGFFGFGKEEPKPLQIMGFTASAGLPLDIVESSEYSLLRDKMEERFGKHEKNGNPNKEVKCIGCYKVKVKSEKQVKLLMEAWRKGLSKIVRDHHFGGIKQIPNSVMNLSISDDMDAYSYIA